MVKAFILYFLNIKPTHGYEIQKYIQINHLESWTKIQSGSIYYALGKLEKEGLIVLNRQEKIGKKIRKIYGITPSGQQALETYFKEELDKMIYDIGSDKFILFPFVGMMDRDVLVQHIEKHIDTLRQKKSDTEKWQAIKVNNQTLQVEKICFDMMIANMDYQIKWHEALLVEIDACIALESQAAKLIKKIDFSHVNEHEVHGQVSGEDDIETLKKEILNNPDMAAEKLEHLIQVLKRK
ncbi:PadR family transcriptional regulator [Vallitalea pronyensis]|uniref:PadR family transcriptional regulator n=1 Tax=Vallitalea pronyensis TaxID=1348613 RepID=A0A8J8MM01_9FIRM|nr:PadR family transcriptional regulator [Vallitalea pronyensis]QUI23723.1 PadR family transcriptional regulator [Vallitalea pronyensis]